MISPDLTTNNPEKQKQSESGGLTLDATGAENHCTILVIEPSPLEKDMLWAASDDGRVHYTKDGGKKCPSYRPLDPTRLGFQVQSYYCSGVTQGKIINPDSCPSGDYMWQINDDDKQCCSNFPQE